MHSLIISAAALSGVLAVTMFFYMSTKESYPGFGHWTAGACLITLGYATNVFRGSLPDIIPIAVGNAFFVCAVILFLQGMRKFLQLSDMHPAWYVVPFLNLIGCSFFYYVQDDVGIRIIFIAVAIAIPQLYTAALVLGHMSKERFLFYPVIAVELIVAGLLMLFRAGWVASQPGFTFFMESPYQNFFFISIMALQIIVSLSFIMLNSERLHSHLLKAKEELEQSISQIKVLSGLLPICSGCKRIRDEHDNWTQMEIYIRNRSEAEFSHGICPECAKKLYPGHWDK
jgi:hypothetical protein